MNDKIFFLQKKFKTISIQVEISQIEIELLLQVKFLCSTNSIELYLLFLTNASSTKYFVFL